jgi:hypothetical protein
VISPAPVITVGWVEPPQALKPARRKAKTTDKKSLRIKFSSWEMVMRKGRDAQ